MSPLSGTRSPNPTQLAAAASASRTRIGILQFSRMGRTCYSAAALRCKEQRLRFPIQKRRCYSGAVATTSTAPNLDIRGYPARVVPSGCRKSCR
jgi:hypothetical protein